MTSRDNVTRFLASGFFSWISFPPAPEYPIRTVSNFFQKYANIVASQGAPPVSKIPAADFATIFASVVDSGGKIAIGVNNTGEFATGVDDIGGKLPPVSMTPAANLPPV
jgi:hypothetical protein